MKKIRSRLLLTGAVLLMCTLLAGCGTGWPPITAGGTASRPISGTPTTPTTAPEQVNSAAVVSSGGVTMVNSYLDENAGSTSANTTSGAAVVSDSTSAADAANSANSTSADANTSSDTEGDSSDSGDSQEYSEDDSSQDDSEYDDSEDAYSEEY